VLAEEKVLSARRWVYRQQQIRQQPAWVRAVAA
jgi:hypothetical protein